jgi:hypothetical protein
MQVDRPALFLAAYCPGLPVVTTRSDSIAGWLPQDWLFSQNATTGLRANVITGIDREPTLIMRVIVHSHPWVVPRAEVTPGGHPCLPLEVRSSVQPPSPRCISCITQRRRRAVGVEVAVEVVKCKPAPSTADRVEVSATTAGTPYAANSERVRFPTDAEATRQGSFLLG